MVRVCLTFVTNELRCLVFSLPTCSLLSLVFFDAVEDELGKIVRIGRRCGTQRNSSSTIMMETDDPNPLPPTEFTQQLLSGVRFATLQAGPKMNTVLPSTVWNPSIHFQYPDSFRSSCREILLCSHAPMDQPPRPTVNAAGLLPRVLWMEVLSYTHRDCKQS